ncbi:MAG: GAF and ANTAR domain-containing protein [Cellulomonas sp.]
MSDVDPVVPSNGATHHPATDLQSVRLATDVVESFLREIADSAPAALGGAISASVTISREGRPVTVASSDAFAAQFDEVQYTQLEGPCLTALRTGETILMDDLAADRRFERYSPRAFALGVRSSLSLPLTGEHQEVGALNLYARDVGGFDAATQADAALFAGDASRALKLAMRLASQVEMTEELRAALQSRTLIDQTLGVIMSQRACDADAAMTILRTDSLNRDVEPLVRAAQILSSASTPPGGDGVPGQH